MSYNHDKNNIDEAVGLNVAELLEKCKNLFITSDPLDILIISKQAEKFEKSFTHKELAVLITIFLRKEVETLKSDISIKKVSRKEIPPEVEKAILSFIKDSEECNCSLCEAERKINKIKIIPLSKGGDA